MATFGKITIGANADTAPSNFMVGSKFTVNEAGTISKFTAYLGGYGASAPCIATIYSDVGGNPTTLLAQSAPFTVPTAPNWYDFVANYTFPLGTYWLVLFFGGSITFYNDTVGTGLMMSSWESTYPTPEPTLQSATVADGVLSINATYTPITPPSLAVTAEATTPTTITGSGSVTFQALATGGSGSYTYQWYDRATGLINGATSAIQTLNFDNVGDTVLTSQIYVVVNDGGSTVQSSPDITVTINPVATVTHMLTLTQTSGGTISANGTVFANGATATVTANVTSGYTLTGWLRNGVAYDGSTNPLSFIMDADYTIQAVFTIQQPTQDRFGNDVIGSSVNTSPTNFTVGSRFVVGVAGVISKLTAYLGGYAGSSPCIALIYSDSGGSPATLIAQSTPITVSALAWYDFPVNYAFNAGTYWLSLLFGGTINFYSNPVGIGLMMSSWESTYPTPKASLVGFATIADGILSIYASYGTGPLQISILPSTDQTVYVGNQLTFNANVSGGKPPYTITWLVNEVSAGTGTQFVYQPSTTGTFAVRATVVDNESTTASSSSVNVTVTSILPPTISVFPLSATVTTNQTQVFTATVTGTSPIVTWRNAVDNTLLFTGNPYPFSTPNAGEYSIFARVTDVAGQYVDSAVIPITVLDAVNGTTPWTQTLEAGTYEVSVEPTRVIDGVTWDFFQWADNGSTNPVRIVVLSAPTTLQWNYKASVPELTASANGPYTPHINTSQYFAGSASGGLPPYAWLWDFGDGSTSTLQNPSHTYTSAGVFNVSLQVSDSNNPKTVTTVYTTATVAGLLPPIASFTAIPSNVLTGQTVSFNGTSSHAQETGATIVSYQWNFGDGSTGTGATATHVYSTVGVMNVVLTVTDSLGLTDTETVPVNVSPPPTWSLTVLPATGGSTSWTGTRTYQSGQASDPVAVTRNINYLFTRWLFDGNDAGTANPLTVVAQTSGTSHTLQPEFTPAPTLTAEAGGPYSAHITTPTIQFAGSASGGVPPIRTWAWTFGDGAVSALQNPTHQYASAGTYNVTLQVIDTDGNTASDSTTVTISNYNPPTAVISNVTPLNPFVGQTVTFDGSGSNVGEPPPTVITSYHWDFGDGSTGSGAVVTHQFASAQAYTVKLTVTDSNGMVNSTTFNITAYAKPQRTFIVQIGANGTASPSAGTYYQDYDTAFTVTARANPHYRLLNWNVNGALSTELTQTIPASATPTTDTYTLTASFEAMIWTLTVSAGINGSVIGTPSGQYLDGTAISESAKPDEGSMYDYWMINGVRDDLNPQSLIMDKDYVMTAYFKPIPTYTVAGLVKDVTETPVMEVRVSAEGTAYSTYTIADGSYILEVPNGTYTIVFEKAGYATVKIPSVSVTGNVIVAPVTISSTPVLAGFPWYVVLIGAGVAGAYFMLRGTKKRSR